LLLTISDRIAWASPVPALGQLQLAKIL